MSFELIKKNCIKNILQIIVVVVTILLFGYRSLDD